MPCKVCIIKGNMVSCIYIKWNFCFPGVRCSFYKTPIIPAIYILVFFDNFIIYILCLNIEIHFTWTEVSICHLNCSSSICLIIIFIGICDNVIIIISDFQFWSCCIYRNNIRGIFFCSFFVFILIRSIGHFIIRTIRIIHLQLIITIFFKRNLTAYCILSCFFPF